MCKIISSQTTSENNYVVKSIRIKGHSTSIGLENYFWQVIERIAYVEKMTVNKLLNKLQDEIFDYTDCRPKSFTSFLRVGCMKYVAHNHELFSDITNQSL